MDINFWGVIHGLKSFLPLLQANPDGGYIVNTASVAAFVAAPGTTAYAASKAAVVAVSEVLAAELDEAGQIGISILAPGLVAQHQRQRPQPPGHRDDGPRTEDFLIPMTVLEPTHVGAMVLDAIRPGPPLRVHPRRDRACRCRPKRRSRRGHSQDDNDNLYQLNM